MGKTRFTAKFCFAEVLSFKFSLLKPNRQLLPKTNVWKKRVLIHIQICSKLPEISGGEKGGSSMIGPLISYLPIQFFSPILLYFFFLFCNRVCQKQKLLVVTNCVFLNFKVNGFHQRKLVMAKLWKHQIQSLTWELSGVIDKKKIGNKEVVSV